jgi:putative salt-induced outer membrane protein|tara:strand:+ start:46386 stop:47084 length:699 start_codon:yes stop_codon:yes gene_type:complete
MKFKIALVIAVLMGTASAWSQWAGEGNLAYSNANGNSNTSALAASLALSKETGLWKHSVGLDAAGSTQDDATTAESYTLDGQTDYSYSVGYYGFGAARYQTDRFSGYDSQASVAAGAGWHVIASEAATFDAELGAGFRKSELQGGIGEESEGVVSLSLIYKRSITETTDIDVSYFTESGGSNRYSEASASARVAMSDALGLRVGYLIRQNSDAPLGSKSTDTLTTLGISYKF